MTSHIFNAHNQCVSTGQNLAIIFSYARRLGGVARVTVDQLVDSRWQALVNVHYVNGWRACTNFADYSHACDWARGRSALSPRVSWWAGCIVECNPLQGPHAAPC